MLYPVCLKFTFCQVYLSTILTFTVSVFCMNVIRTAISTEVTEDKIYSPLSVQKYILEFSQSLYETPPHLDKLSVYLPVLQYFSVKFSFELRKL